MFYSKGRECALLQENEAQISYHLHALHGEGFLHGEAKLQGALFSVYPKERKKDMTLYSPKSRYEKGDVGCNMVVKS
jgi:hypothetical protein